MKPPAPSLRRILRHLHAWGLALRVALLLIAFAGGDHHLIPLLCLSAGAYAAGGPLVRTGRWNALHVLCAFEWFFFVRIWFVYFGWQCGFSLHYLAVPLFTLLLDHFDLRTRVRLAALPMLFILPLLTLVPPLPPVIELDASRQKLLLGLNSGLFLLIAGAIVVHAMRSVVREKRHAEALAESRTRLIANMSHELKTPLAAMLTTLQATLVRPREPEHYRETLGVLERNTRGLGQLVRRMLDFVSAEDVALRAERRPVGLPALLASCLDELRPVAEQRGVTLELQAPAASPPVETDPDLLAVVLRNLLANAIRYSPAGRPVVVSLGCSPAGTPVITVRDQGPGIAPEVLPRIFEPFFRGDAARSRAEGTFGLGLAIVADYVALLGCHIEVDTEPGRGTAFILTLGAPKS